MSFEQRGNLVDAIAGERFSCRAYQQTPVPRATIEAVLATAQRSASWCNAQPWQVTIISGDALDTIRAVLPAHAEANKPDPDFAWPAAYLGIYNERRRECGLQLYAATGVQRGDREAANRQRLENFRFFGAPHVALITSDEALGIYGAVDCGGYVAAFMLAARAHGVASIAQAALAAYAGFWRDRLALPPDRRIVCGISFGFEDASHPANGFRTPRASLADSVRWVD